MSLVGRAARNHPQQVTDPDVDDRATHPLIFGPLDDRFTFTVDVAASADNTKCRRYFTAEQDGLKEPWAGETVWCNPPYSDIAPWVRKAWAEREALAVVMLLPANRTEQQWWQLYVEPFRDRPGSPLRCEFLPGRIRFMKPGQTAIGPNERPPFGCCLLIWERLAWSPDQLPNGGLFE